MKMEKAVKGDENRERASRDSLNLKLSELQSTLNSTLEAVRSLGLAVSQPAAGPSQGAGAMASIPPELARQVSAGIRDAADMGDITQLKSIAAQLRSQGDAFAPISEKIIQCADNIDFEGIASLADELEAKS